MCRNFEPQMVTSVNERFQFISLESGNGRRGWPRGDIRYARAISVVCIVYIPKKIKEDKRNPVSREAKFPEKSLGE